MSAPTRFLRSNDVYPRRHNTALGPCEGFSACGDYDRLALWAAQRQATPSSVRLDSTGGYWGNPAPGRGTERSAELLNSFRRLDRLRLSGWRVLSMKNRLLAGFFLASAWAAAQEFRGAVLGRITDTTGAVIVGADIRVVNTETNVAASTRSNQDGNYQVPFLNPGN